MPTAPLATPGVLWFFVQPCQGVGWGRDVNVPCTCTHVGCEKLHVETQCRYQPLDSAWRFSAKNLLKKNKLVFTMSHRPWVQYNIILLTKRSRVLHFKSVTSTNSHLNKYQHQWNRMFLVSSDVLPSFPPQKKTGTPQFHGTSCQSPLGLLHHPFDFVGPFASAELLPGGFGCRLWWKTHTRWAPNRSL